MAHPRKAWLIAPHAPEVGVDRDLVDLERLFTRELAPDCRAAVEVVRSDVGTLTSARLCAALDAIDAFDGHRFVWIGGHGARRGLDTAFFATDDRNGGHITVEALWRRLDRSARRGRGMLFVVLDICHAAPAPASPLIKQLEASLLFDELHGLPLQLPVHTGVPLGHLLRAVPHLRPEHDAVDPRGQHQRIERAPQDLAAHALLDAQLGGHLLHRVRQRRRLAVRARARGEHQRLLRRTGQRFDIHLTPSEAVMRPGLRPAPHQQPRRHPRPQGLAGLAVGVAEGPPHVGVGDAVLLGQRPQQRRRKGHRAPAHARHAPLMVPQHLAQPGRQRQVARVVGLHRLDITMPVRPPDPDDPGLLVDVALLQGVQLARPHAGVGQHIGLQQHPPDVEFDGRQPRLCVHWSAPLLSGACS